MWSASEYWFRDILLDVNAFAEKKSLQVLKQKSVSKSHADIQCNHTINSSPGLFARSQHRCACFSILLKHDHVLVAIHTADHGREVGEMKRAKVVKHYTTFHGSILLGEKESGECGDLHARRSSFFLSDLRKRDLVR